jgi:DNA (cytosine-5)-methyltransferase 1
VEKLKPKAFVAENVTGLIKGSAKGYVNEILNRAREIGYDVQLFMLNAAFMGVPQRRERVFFIGNRVGLPKLKLDFDEEPIDFRSVRSKESGKKIIPSLQKIMPYYRKGDKDLKPAAKRAEGKGKFFNYAVIEDCEVAKTLTSDVKLIRGCDTTFFTESDARNVSSFPQDYDFSGRNPYFITGMSVPPSMMANIAHEIRHQWLDKEQ